VNALTAIWIGTGERRTVAIVQKSLASGWKTCLRLLPKGRLTRLRGFAVGTQHFSAIGTRYQFEIPRRYFAATAENRCSEDLPYSHDLIRVPTIVLRELEVARRHKNQPKLSSA